MLWLLLTILISLSGCKINTDSQEVVTDFTPIIDNEGADPWVYQEDDDYYYTKTTGNNVTLQRSKTLTQIATGEEKVVFEAASDFESIWAPEIHRLDDQWVCYFAANKPGETHRMYALINEAEDPYKGQWILEAVTGMDDKFAIDGTVFESNDHRYFVWSGWEGYVNVAQNLYISEMVSPTEVNTDKFLLSEPEFDWEKKQSPLINEGPQILVRNQTINLVYSASGSWDNDYCLGLLTLDTAKDPLKRENWQKADQPIFKSENEVFGPGHNGFAQSKDGGEEWLVYHAARWDHGGWNRSIRMQKIKWSEDDKLNLETPLAENKRQHLPKGENQRYRLLADKAQQDGEFEEIEDGNSLSEKVIRGFENPFDQLTWTFQAPQAGTYSLLIYVKPAEMPRAEMDILINVAANGQEEQVPLPFAQYYQPLQIRVNLEKGKNEIFMQSDIGIDPICVDRLEIVKID